MPMKHSLKPLAPFLMVAALSVTTALAAEFSVEKFMEKTHKGKTSISKKASDGQASKEELKKLLEGYQAMAAAKPEKGDAASWKEKTTALVTATQAMISQAPSGVASYKKAVNCKACHSVHKPD